MITLAIYLVGWVLYYVILNRPKVTWRELVAGMVLIIASVIAEGVRE